MKIRLGHSPDSDDAFMFWGLATGAVKTDLEFEHILKDIQTLNEWAMEGRLESTAISVHAFAHVADQYALLRHGGSFGDGYGPMIVANCEMSFDELATKKIAIPGKLTSAFLQLQLWWADQLARVPVGASVHSSPITHHASPTTHVVPFDQIIPRVQSGEFEAGLIIHEGQLTYAQEGLSLIADMGKWWREKTGLPLPLGVNVVRKDLGDKVVREVSRCMRESISAGLEHREEALTHALQYARGLDVKTSDQFVGMYVNERTKDMGEDGVRAIKLLLAEGAKAGLVPEVEVTVVD